MDHQRGDCEPHATGNLVWRPDRGADDSTLRRPAAGARARQKRNERMFGKTVSAKRRLSFACGSRIRQLRHERTSDPRLSEGIAKRQFHQRDHQHTTRFPPPKNPAQRAELARDDELAYSRRARAKVRFLCDSFAKATNPTRQGGANRHATNSPARAAEPANFYEAIQSLWLTHMLVLTFDENYPGAAFPSAGSINTCSRIGRNRCVKASYLAKNWAFLDALQLRLRRDDSNRQSGHYSGLWPAF